jgi:hypothetical protein
MERLNSKNAIVILANNYSLLQTQVDNLPELECDYIVCAETRIGTDLEKISQILRTSVLNDQKILGTNVFILDSQDIVKEFSKIIETSFLHNYTMGMNILLQWYMHNYYNYEKVIFTEEDVILTPNVENIFQEDHCLFYTWGMSAQCGIYDKLSRLVREYVDEWDKLFDLKLNSENYEDIWKNTHLSSGQRMYVRGTYNIKKYTDYLVKFFNSKVFEDRWLNRRTHRTGYLDERFEGFFAYKTDILNNDIKPYTYLEIGKPEKANISKYNKIEKCKGIWHNATINQKQKWIDALKLHGKIN